MERPYQYYPFDCSHSNDYENYYSGVLLADVNDFKSSEESSIDYTVFNSTVDKVSEIDFSSGAMDSNDLWGWYNAGVNIEKATWNQIGDYCILSLTNVHTKEGWGNVYYSLPFPYTVSTHGLAKASNYNTSQDIYWSLSDEIGTKVLRVSSANGALLINATFSITIIYKYK